MSRTGPLPETWRYALLGGLVAGYLFGGERAVRRGSGSPRAA